MSRAREAGRRGVSPEPSRLGRAGGGELARMQEGRPVTRACGRARWATSARTSVLHVRRMRCTRSRSSSCGSAPSRSSPTARGGPLLMNRYDTPAAPRLASAEVLVRPQVLVYSDVTMAKPKRGDLIELVVDDLAFGGDGVGRADGYVVFVRGGLPGDH